MHQLSTPDSVFDWDSAAKPSPPSVLRELAEAAGVQFNGSAPWNIQVFGECVYRMILPHV